jgi:uncharacterized protein
MTSHAAMRAPAVTAPNLRWFAAGSLTTDRLANEDTTEVLNFLGERPLRTVFMVSLIRDNGLVSPLNRGTFYGCRNSRGQLEGVALIGHATLIETCNETALQAFVRLAQGCVSAHVIMAEQEKVERFWASYAGGGQAAHRLCRELLLELRWPAEISEPVEGLRLATLDEIELVMPVQAEMAFEECGINPMEKDPDGFRQRCARRIEQGRVWVLVENGHLIFKADIISDTPDVIYLEGVWVNPAERGKGYGLRCMSQLSRILLERTVSVSVLVNEVNRKAQSLYRRAGYRFRGFYDTIYLRQEN